MLQPMGKARKEKPTGEKYQWGKRRGVGGRA
jgi:hypothetical protein